MKHYDITIIGAGIAGTGIAAHLPADKKVRLLEMEAQPGYHTTGRSAALFVGNYGNATIRALNALSLPRFKAPKVYGIERPLLFARGELVLIKPSQTGHFEQLLADSASLQEITITEAHTRLPLLREGLYSRAALEREAYEIDVDLLHQSWLKIARQRGHELLCSSPVQALAFTDDRWRIKTPGDEFSSTVVVNASGAWADKLAALAGVPAMGLIPKRRSIAVVPVPESLKVDRWPLCMDGDENWYALPRAGKLLISPADADPVPAGDAYVDDLVLAEGIDRFESAMNLSVERVEHSWAGLRTFAPDNTLVVGFDSHMPGFFWLAGQGGYGIQTAPAISEIAAALIQGHSTQPLLEQALAPQRFNKQ